MSIFLCTKCDIFHNTISEMNNCNHIKKDNLKEEHSVLSIKSSVKEIKAEAKKAGIKYTSKKETLNLLLSYFEA